MKRYLCVLLMLALLLILLTLRRQDPFRWSKPLRTWRLFTLGCGELFLIPRMVSTALEVFFPISAALLARRLWLLAKAQEPPGGAKGGPHGKI